MPKFFVEAEVETDEMDVAPYNIVKHDLETAFKTIDVDLDIDKLKEVL